MPKRPDTTETVLLALELLRRIPRSGSVSASKLHMQLASAGIARELRTIQRQLDVLCRHFDDIERDDSSKPYEYRWKERSKGIAISKLSEQESLLLSLAEQHLRNLLPDALMRSMESFFTQARSNLGEDSSPKLARQWLSKVRVISETQRLLPPKIKAGVFEAVSDALYKNLWLNINYRNASGKQMQSQVMPLGLAQQGPNLYLVCRFDGHNEERTLAFHRFQSATVSTLTFERPKDFNLQKYADEGRFGFGEGKRIKLAFRIEKLCGAHLLETPLSEDQLVKDVDGWLRISATVVDSGHLDWWLRGFGENVMSIRKQRLPAHPPRASV